MILEERDTNEKKIGFDQGYKKAVDSSSNMFCW